MTFEEIDVDDRRRRMLVATATVGTAAGVVAAVPFVASFTPSERAKSAGAPVEVDFSSLPAGQKMTVEWQGKPVWILHRSQDMLDSIKTADDLVVDPNSEKKQTDFEAPPSLDLKTRSLKAPFLIVVGICTHLGCSPTAKFNPGAGDGMDAGWPGGFLCPCHGSKFDLAGRVYKNMPAPTHLPVPPHIYLADTKVLIGENKKQGTS